MTKEQYLDNQFDKMTISVDRNQYGRYICFKIVDNIYIWNTIQKMVIYGVITAGYGQFYYRNIFVTMWKSNL